MDLEKVRAILEWSHPQSIKEVRSFHGMATCYLKCIQKFSWIVAPITNFTKGKTFISTNEAKESFNFLKKIVTKEPILALPYSDELFEVGCDASHVGIGDVLSQEGRPIAFFG